MIKEEKIMKLVVRDLVGPICITQEDGEKVFERILLELNNKQSVTIDFSDVNIFASPFFNTAIGRLFRQFIHSELDELLTSKTSTPPVEKYWTWSWKTQRS